MQTLRMLLTTAFLVIAVATSRADDDIVREWNETMLAAIRLGAPRPTVIARSLFLVQTSVYDAWSAYDANAISVQLNAEKRPVEEQTLANKEKAVSYAAYRALTTLFTAPAQVSLFNEKMAALGFDPNDVSTDLATPQGIGNQSATGLIQSRSNDGSNQANNYVDTTGYQPVNSANPTANNAPGNDGFDANRWQPLRVPTGVVRDGNNNPIVDPNNPASYTDQRFLTPQWGGVKPFAMVSGDQFRPPAPPQKGDTSRFVEAVGIDSTTGTLITRVTTNDVAWNEQTDQILNINANLSPREKAIAEFWADGPRSETPPGHWNQLAHGIIDRETQGNASAEETLDYSVKLYFALDAAVFDASIASWDAKRAYDFIRPISAIRDKYTGQTILAWAGPNQGTQSIPGEQWQPYQQLDFVTPAFPEYTSGHSTFSAASAAAIAMITGTTDFYDGVTTTGQDINGDGHNDLLGEITITGLRFENYNGEPIVLRWDTLWDAANEAGISRRDGGIHFQEGDLRARAAGRKIGELAYAHTISLSTGRLIRADDAIIIHEAADFAGGIDAGDSANNIQNSGGVFWIDAGGGNDQLSNSGTIDYYVNGGAGDDTITNSGVISGDILGGAGTDELIFTGGGDYSSTIGQIEQLTIEADANDAWRFDVQSAIYAGRIDVTSGRLILDGETHANSVAAPIMTVDGANTANPILSGNGFIEADVSIQNGGIVAPGSSVGTLQIDGDYTMDADSELQVEIDASGADRVEVSGNVTLLGGVLSGEYINGFVPRDGDAWPIVTAAAVNGTFGTLNLPSVGILNLSVRYASTEVELLVDAGLLTSVAITANQRSVAGALDRIRATANADLITVYTELDPLPPAAMRAALDSLAPETPFVQDAFVARVLQLQEDHIVDRSRRLRSQVSTSGQVSTAGLRIQDDGGSSSLPAMDSDTSSSLPAGWGAFVTGNIVRGERDLSAQARNQDYRTNGVTVGLDYRLGADSALGGAITYADDEADERQGEVDSEAVALTLFGTTGIGVGYLDGYLGCGQDDFDSSRQIVVGGAARQAEATSDATHITAGVTTGCRLAAGDLRFGPMAGLNYSHIDFDDYSETGAGSAGVRVRDRSEDSMRGLIGITAEFIRDAEWGHLIPRVKVQVEHELEDMDHEATAEFIGNPGSSFKVYGVTNDRDWITVGADVRAVVGERCSGFIGYETYMGNRTMDDDNYSLGIEVAF